MSRKNTQHSKSNHGSPNELINISKIQFELLFSSFLVYYILIIYLSNNDIHFTDF